LRKQGLTTELVHWNSVEHLYIGRTLRGIYGQAGRRATIPLPAQSLETVVRHAVATHLNFSRQNFLNTKYF